MDDEASRLEALGVLRNLIERTTVTPDPDGQGKTAVLKGDLGRLLSYAVSKDETARVVNAGSSIRLVAGVGFEPTIPMAKASCRAAGSWGNDWGGWGSDAGSCAQ